MEPRPQRGRSQGISATCREASPPDSRSASQRDVLCRSCQVDWLFHIRSHGFGGGTEIVRDGDKDHLWEILEDGLNTSAIFEKVPWLAAFAPFVPSLGKNLKVMRGGALMRTQQRYKSGPIHKDLFYYLSNEDGKEEVSPPPHIVISDGALALVAGSHTTSSVLANAIYLILCHPQVYGRLRRDIDAFYPPGDDAADPKYYAEIPYLDAVINETLRLFPAVPSGIQRAPVVGTGDKMIGPYYLPEGSNVRVHVWSLHHDPRNFSRPDAFWPERWLIADGFKEGESTPSSEKFNHNLDAFVPFSYGPAHCVGKNLAMQEMRVFVACMMHELNLRFTEGWDPVNWERDMEDRQSMRVGRLPVVAERRSGRGN
ncbi:hypothetical protein NM688_g8462 [Phlebia brevispora]|uniref:Uncharacterized protein n=1 Tax=Phlebia brevispora TaxID=194682 RepID=A0ACC1RUJ4_9APHY|nr:hypothetical protein NM688_g8462 [Phlebia brevispora]